MKGIDDVVEYRVLRYVSLFPYLFHVSVNSIIYSIVDKEFRQKLSKLLPGCNILNRLKIRANHDVVSVITESKTFLVCKIRFLVITNVPFIQCV